jgi:multimeric flavodoxin WrbA
MIEEADKVIVAAPVFSMNINALAKAMIDRMQMYWARKYVLKYQEKSLKPGMFISTSGMKLQGVHDCSKKTMKYFYKMLDIEYKLDFFVSKVDAPGDILSKPKELKEFQEVLKLF